MVQQQARLFRQASDCKVHITHALAENRELRTEVLRNREQLAEAAGLIRDLDERLRARNAQLQLLDGGAVGRLPHSPEQPKSCSSPGTPTEQVLRRVPSASSFLPVPPPRRVFERGERAAQPPHHEKPSEASAPPITDDRGSPDTAELIEAASTGLPASRPTSPESTASSTSDGGCDQPADTAPDLDPTVRLPSSASVGGGGGGGCEAAPATPVPLAQRLASRVSMETLASASASALGVPDSSGDESGGSGSEGRESDGSLNGSSPSSSDSPSSMRATKGTPSGGDIVEQLQRKFELLTAGMELVLSRPIELDAEGESLPPVIATGRRSALAPTSYAEPSLRGKLRRGDKFTFGNVENAEPQTADPPLGGTVPASRCHRAAASACAIGGDPNALLKWARATAEREIGNSPVVGDGATGVEQHGHVGSSQPQRP